jgi:hypothetical protein
MLNNREMRNSFLRLLAPALLCASAMWTTSDVSAYDPRLNYLIPLPKEIRIEGEMLAMTKEISVRVRDGANDVERTAAMELASHFGTSIAETPRTDGIELLVGALDDYGRAGEIDLNRDAVRLRSLPNADQAYIIRRDGSHRLVLAGLTGEGVYYAVQTLKQLAVKSGSGDSWAIPMIVVTDWPDLQYRGVWDDTFPAEQVEWLSSMKMNLVDCLTRLTVDDDGRGRLTAMPSKGPTEIDGVPYATFCRLHAVRFVPVILHFSHLARTGIYRKYPFLVGVGSTIDDRFIPPCAKRPEFVAVLADWMESLASQPDVGEISVWLSEVEQQCGCPDCLKAGQYVMEARAIVQAYRRAREKYPNLRVRVLLTQGSYPTNEKVLEELPPEIGAVYYHGEKTYDSSREPMIPFSLRDYAARGNMLGVCPQLTVSWALVCPWCSPQFVKKRMNEFVEKRLGLVSSYATPNLFLYDFNIAAAAEWSWNSRGRSEREFALAWATRRGIKDPGAAADWAVLHGDVSWDIYGSGVPFTFVPGFGTAEKMIVDRVRPVLGEDMFRYFPDVAGFDEAIAANGRALEMARRSGDPAILEETLVVGGYIGMARELYTIMEWLTRDNPPKDIDRAEIERHYDALRAACSETNAALKRWESLFGEGEGGGRFTSTLTRSDDIVALVRQAIDRAGSGKNRE